MSCWSNKNPLGEQLNKVESWLVKLFVFVDLIFEFSNL
jgi:hypothetical protein